MLFCQICWIRLWMFAKPQWPRQKTPKNAKLVSCNNTLVNIAYLIAGWKIHYLLGPGRFLRAKC